MTYPVGRCSQARAKRLMMAPAVSGGAVYVDLPEIPGLTLDQDGDFLGFLCHGMIADVPVPTTLLDPGDVLARLAAEATRMEALAGYGGDFATFAEGLRAAHADIAAAVARWDA